MLQRNIGMYLANKVKDEIFGDDTEEEVEHAEVQHVEAEIDQLDGELIRDASGAILGRAYRVPAAVYVIANSAAEASSAFESTLDDPNHEAIIHWGGGEIEAVVYVNSEAREKAEKGPRGFRADDV